MGGMAKAGTANRETAGEVKVRRQKRPSYWSYFMVVGREKKGKVALLT
jgi:hypothetical protein